jgi:dienelactone hydrolase
MATSRITVKRSNVGVVRLSAWLVIWAFVIAPSEASVIDNPVTPPAVETTTELDEQIDAARAFGPFGVEILREKDGLRNGPKYAGATIYHPVIKDAKATTGDEDGDANVDSKVDAKVAPPKEPELTNLSSVVLVPGFMGPERSMSRWGPYLASHGFVVMTIGTNNLTVKPDARGEALVDGLVTIRAENEREGSPLFGRLDPERVAVGGWSMGGGGAQVAATLDPSIKAVLALCPWKPEPCGAHDVPVFFLGGERDGPAPVKKHALKHYESLPDRTPKLLYEVRGGGHSLPMNPRYAGGDVGRFSLAWLKVYLEGDESWRPLLEAKPANASRFLIELPEVERPEEIEEPATSGAAPEVDEKKAA